MFTGIVECMGIVAGLTPPTARLAGGDAARLTLRRQALLRDLPLGASVAVNGVCLTIAAQSDETTGFDLVPETLQRTNLGGLKSGDAVNLERSLRVGSPIDGHIVQGHVDGAGVIHEIASDAGGWKVWVRLGAGLLRYVVPKGSIALDGVSLTVVDVRADAFSVALIPFTLEHTTLGRRKTGALVNIETDILTRAAVERVEALLPELAERFARGGVA